MWTRNNNVSNWNMLKHFIYLSSDKSTTSSLCSLYYRYSSKPSSFFCILSFLVKVTSIDQTFYSATHYLAAVWLDSRHDLNTTWTSWAKKVSIKKEERVWYSKSVESFNIINDTQKYKQFVQYMQIKRRLSMKIIIKSNDDWNLD